jgi:hypothetical protein
MVLKYDAIGCSRIPNHNVRLSPNKSDSALGIFKGRFKFTFFLSTQDHFTIIGLETPVGSLLGYTCMTFPSYQKIGIFNCLQGVFLSPCTTTFLLRPWRRAPAVGDHNSTHLLGDHNSAHLVMHNLKTSYCNDPIKLRRVFVQEFQEERRSKSCQSFLRKIVDPPNVYLAKSTN